MELFGTTLVGVTAENGRKLVLSLGLLVIVLCLHWMLRRTLAVLHRRRPFERLGFWIRQGIDIATMVLLALGLLSIWFDNPTRLATAVGLVTAGLAFALQRVVSALAGYLVILRGELFTVGDRITMGGVRGDVINLGFTTTQIFEMGQPPDEEDDNPSTWIRSRQPTGRVVGISNARVFDEPICNYSREFWYIWEEIALPIPFDADRKLVEEILLRVANARTRAFINDAAAAIRRFSSRYAIRNHSVEPRVYIRITENWLEFTIRFVAPIHGDRELKDELTRDILQELDTHGIDLASVSNIGLDELPEIRIRQAGSMG